MRTVRTATGEEAEVVCEGEMQIQGEGGSPIVLQNVLYVPLFTTSLLSVSKIFESGGHIKYVEGGKKVQVFSATSNLPVLVAEKDEGLWRVSNKTIKIHFSDVEPEGVALVSRGETLETSKATLEDWHCRLGHLG